MKKALESKISKLINTLSNSEDVRQDLWLDYLSGVEPSTLFYRAHQHRLRYRVQSENQLLDSQILSTPPSDKFMKLYTDTERELMYLITSGYNVGEICVHLGINQVGLERLLSSIKSKRMQEETWLSKDHLQTKKSTA